MTQKCAELIADKLDKLVRMSGVEASDIKIDWGGQLMQVALKSFRDPSFKGPNDEKKRRSLQLRRHPS